MALAFLKVYLNVLVSFCHTNTDKTCNILACLLRPTEIQIWEIYI